MYPQWCGCRLSGSVRWARETAICDQCSESQPRCVQMLVAEICWGVWVQSHWGPIHSLWGGVVWACAVAPRDKRPFSVHHGDRWACRLLCLHLVVQSLLAMLVSSPTAPHLHLHFSCKYHSLTESFSDALLLMKLFLSSAKIWDFLDCDFHWTKCLETRCNNNKVHVFQGTAHVSLVPSWFCL